MAPADDVAALRGRTIEDAAIRDDPRSDDSYLWLRLDDGSEAEVHGDWDVFASLGVVHLSIRRSA